MNFDSARHDFAIQLCQTCIQSRYQDALHVPQERNQLFTGPGSKSFPNYIHALVFSAILAPCSDELHASFDPENHGNTDEGVSCIEMIWDCRHVNHFLAKLSR